MTLVVSFILLAYLFDGYSSAFRDEWNGVSDELTGGKDDYLLSFDSGAEGMAIRT